MIKIIRVNPPIRHWNRFVTENAITWKEGEGKRKIERQGKGGSVIILSLSC